MPTQQQPPLAAQEGINAFLDDVRRRQILVHAVRDSGFCFAVFALGLLALVLLASVLSPSRTTTLVGLSVIVAGAMFFVLHIVALLRRLKSRAHLANLVGKRFPSLRSDLLSTIELRTILEGESIADDAAGGNGQGRFSTSLYRALVAQTHQHLQRRSARAVAPTRLLRPTAQWLTLSVVCWAVLSAAAPTRLANGFSLLFNPSTGARADTATIPLLADLDISYVYPKYMQRKDKHVRSSTGHITAPPGTRVKLRGRTLVPSRGVTLVFQQGTPPKRTRLQLSRAKRTPSKKERNARPGSKDSARLVVGEVVLSTDGQYYFELDTIDGRVLRDPVTHRVEIEPDNIPRAILYGPRNDIEVTGNQRVEVGFSAEDDHGLRQVDLVYKTPQRPAARQPLWKASGQRQSRATGKAEWDLSTLDLRPGSRVAYWIEVRDNDTINGPKRGNSATAYLRVFDPEDRLRQTLAQQKQIVEQALRILAERLLLFADRLGANLQLDRARVMFRAQARLVDSVRELRNQMRENKLFSEAAFRSISAMRKRLKQLLSVETRLLRELALQRRRGALRDGHLQSLRAHNGKQISALERDTLTLADLLQEQQLQSLLRASQSLSEARKRLVDLLRRYRKTRDEKLRREIKREIASMQQQLRQLLARMSQLRSSIPDEYLNIEAIKTVKLAKTLAKMSSLDANNVQQVESFLRSLDKDLAQLRQLLKDNLQSYRSGRMPAQEAAYGKLLDKLRTLETSQRRMAKQTKRIIDNYRRKAAAVLRNRIAPFIQRQQRKLAKLQHEVAEIDRRALASYQKEQLQRIRKRLEGLRNMLKQRDLDEAMNMAHRANNGLKTLRDDVAEDIEARYGYGRTRLRRALRHTRRAQALAAELEKDLESVFPEPASLLSNDDRQRLRRLRRGQQKLRRAADQLAAKLRKPDDKHPSDLGAQLPQGLKQASGLMEQAAGKLGAVKPQQAHSNQKAAADRLAQARRALKRSRQSRGVGQPTFRDRVTIPSAEAFAPPKAFREEILDAMKEKPPLSYEREVKRYYEELVR